MPMSVIFLLEVIFEELTDSSPGCGLIGGGVRVGRVGIVVPFFFLCNVVP